MGAARAAAGVGEAMGTHDGSRNLILFVTVEASWSGGDYKEMSSILADQYTVKIFYRFSRPQPGCQ